MRRLLIFPLLAISLFAQGGQPIPIPNLPTVIYLDYNTVSRDTGVKPADLQRHSNGGYPGDGIYTLTFSHKNGLTVYPGYFEINLYAGTQFLCSFDDWSIRNYYPTAMTCTVPSYLIYDQFLPSEAPADPNAHLIVNFVPEGGWPVLLENVSLTFTPSN